MTNQIADEQSIEDEGSLQTATMGNQEWLLLFVLALMWGGSFYFIELAVEELRPFTIVLVRVGLAALVLLSVAAMQGETIPRAPKIWGGFVLMALLSNVIPFSLIAWGQTQIEGGLASIILAATPIFATVLAHFFNDNEPMTTPRLLGVLLGICGVTILIGPSFLSGIGQQGMGQLAVLLAAFSYGVVAVVGSRMRSVSPIINSAGMLSCATIMMIPLSFYIERPWTLRPSMVTILAVVALAVISTAIAYLLYFRILSVAGASNASLVTLLIPVSAVMLGALLLGERLPWTAFAGMAVIFGGLLVIDGRFLGRGLKAQS